MTAWKRFWSVEPDPGALRRFHCALGCLLAGYYLLLLPSWQAYYGLNWGVYALCLAAAGALAAGKGGKLPMMGLWLANLLLMHRAPELVNGEERVFAILLGFGLFLPRGWAFRLIQIHLVAIYAISMGWRLALDRSWLDGSAVYFAMNAMLFPRWPGLEVFVWNGAIVSRALTWATAALELAFPALVWRRSLRVPLTLAMMVLHACLALMLEGLMLFNLSMIVGLTLFLESKPAVKAYARL
jgi:hypothetical protein